MNPISTNNGPFGICPKRSIGYVLNAMVQYGIPEHTVKEIQDVVGDAVGGSILTAKGDLFGEYRYFQGIEQPLFNFHDEKYMKQPVVADPETGVVKPVFRLNLSADEGAAALIVSDRFATSELYCFIKEMVNIDADSAAYKKYELTMNANAALSDNKYFNSEGRCVHVVFWNPSEAQAFVDYINENYMVQKSAEVQRTYTISTYAHRIDAYPKYSKHFTRAGQKNNSIMADFDDITDAEELYRALRSADIPAFKNYLI
jgi:hypothetical protein